jgi:hypothetical protein
MKVRYIGGEAEIGSRATLAFARRWNIDEWVDVDSLGNAYWDQFGKKISANIYFEVEGVAPDVSDLAAVDADLDDVVAGQLADEPAPARKPRKKKGE